MVPSSHVTQKNQWQLWANWSICQDCWILILLYKERKKERAKPVEEYFIKLLFYFILIFFSPSPMFNETIICKGIYIAGKKKGNFLLIFFETLLRIKHPTCEKKHFCSKPLGYYYNKYPTKDLLCKTCSSIVEIFF
jgi:hypothetical protein